MLFRSKKFCARIATGDYDAIIMGHSQFERIPISRERQERLLYEQIDEITEGIAEVQASGGERFTVKQLERTRKSLEDCRSVKSPYPGSGVPQHRGAAYRTSAGNGQSSFGACIAGTQRNC